jgi:hypothetical protein
LQYKRANSKTRTMSQFDSQAGVSSTPGAKGVDHNGIVVGRWKAEMFGCCSPVIPNGMCCVVIKTKSPKSHDGCGS